MKLSTLVIALSLTAAGGAFAQSGGPGNNSTDMQQQYSTGATTTQSAGDTTGKPNVFKRMGTSVKNGFNKLTHKNDTAANARTNTMGAAPAASSDTTDAGRQARIDAAYANYKAKQK